MQRALGDVAFHYGRLEEAEQRYRDYLSLVEQDNHLWSITQAHGRISWILAHRDDLAGSRASIRTCFTLLKDAAHNDLILCTLLSEVRCLIAEGKFASACALATYVAEHPLTWKEFKDQAHALLQEAESGLPVEERARPRLSG